MELSYIIDLVFSHPPRPPCTFMIETGDSGLFSVLMSILIEGAKRLYGDYVTPMGLGEHQVERIKAYMESLGYSLKYRVRDASNAVDIWFEPYLPYYTCHTGGRILC